MGTVEISFLFVSLTWFVWFYLGAGRRWLAWTITGHRTIHVMLIFLAGMNVNSPPGVRPARRSADARIRLGRQRHRVAPR